MAQENNTAREQTALEKLSQDALNQARRERKMIQDTCIAELAQCDTCLLYTSPSPRDTR